MTYLLLIGVGGFFGTLARHVIDRRVSGLMGASLPWGTFVINMTGSFVLGLMFALVVERAELPPALRGPLMIGFIGAYTTFSTLMIESLRLFEEGAWAHAFANLGGSVVLGMLAVFGGLAVGRAI